MTADFESTVFHYRKKALELALKYESADVASLQMDLREAMHFRHSVLELGCGSGRDAAFLNRLGTSGSITATDASPEMLREAGRIHPEIAVSLEKLVLPHDLHTMAGAGRRFSGVYSIAALMHLSLEHIEETIGLLELITEPGGILFLSVCTERDNDNGQEERIFTLQPPKWWKKQIEKTCFRIAEMKTTPDGLDRKNTSWINITAVR
jgi:cyclopropane fatty-acyl-phospholipid synthase-like methyltransferase